MIRIVADDRIPFLRGAFEEVAKVSYLPGSEIRQPDLKDAECLITRTRTRCDRTLLEHTGIRMIASATIGFDHIDTEYCRKAGIRWTNAPGCNASSVQQYMVSVLLHLALRMGFDLRDLTLGVVGVGHVGSLVAEAAEALGVNVLLNDPPRQRAEGGAQFTGLDRLLEEADIITLHVPLNRGGRDNTAGMVDRRFMERVRKGTILVNTSRGEVVDESALLEGIRKGRLAGTVLDVFSGEPAINRDLLDVITIGTPHIAGYSLDGKAGGTTMAVRAVSRFFKLGLDRWSPPHIPPPDSSGIRADASGKDRGALLWEVYSQTYDVTGDDRKLREDPGAFEMLRGSYPQRREPPAWTLRLRGGTAGTVQVFRTLGFNVIQE